MPDAGLTMPTFPALRDRVAADRGSGVGPASGLARALAAIGWGAVGDPSPEELGGYLADLVDACVHEHGDVDLLVRAVASVLRDHGPLLDGGLPPVAAYEPAAADLLDRYVAGEERPRPRFDLA